MKVLLERTAKIASVSVPNIAEAGWMGFYFARDNRDLVEAGWKLYYYDEKPEGRADQDRSERIEREGRPITSWGSVADVIRDAERTCPTCGQRLPTQGDV